jgi:signal transduction histidine kinase
MTASGARSDAAAAGAGPLAPQALAGLGAIGRVARALVGAASLSDVARRGLAEMREALDFELAALYLPAASGRPLLQSYASSAHGASARRAADEIAFDEEAWRLAVASGTPLVFHDEGSWLVENPFDPSATYWMVLPLPSQGRVLGVVIAASAHRMALEPTGAAVVTLIGDLLTAGIAAAELRQALERTELERERARLAALVHDDLAQDLALAVRELAVLDADPPPDVARASRERLREAVGSAHVTVRERLKELAAPVPLGGIRHAVRDICDRFERRGMAVRLRQDGPEVQVAPATGVTVTRVLTEALMNIEKHAGTAAADVHVAVEDERVTITVRDTGTGFEVDPAPSGAATGHLGLELMRERARASGGTLRLTSRPGQGTLVRLQIPT